MALFGWIGDLFAPLVEGVGEIANTFVSTVTGTGLGDSVGDLLTKSTGQDKLLANQQSFTTAERISSQEYQTQERLSSQAWQQNMWQEQQRTGAALQLQGLIDAGVNPNTAVATLGGSSAVPSPTNSSAPSGEVVGAPSPAPLSSLFEFLPSMIKATSDSRLSKALASKANEETKGIIIDNSWKIPEKEASIAELYGRVSSHLARAGVDEAQAKQIRDLLPFIKGKTIAETNLLADQAFLVRTQRSEVLSNIDLIRQKIDESKQYVKTLSAEEYEAYMSGNQHKKAVELYGKQMSVAEAEEELKKSESRLNTINADWKEFAHKHGVEDDGSLIDRFIVWKHHSAIVYEEMEKDYHNTETGVTR